MNADLFSIMIGIAAVSIFVFALAIGIKIGIFTAQRHIHKQVKEARKDAVKRSRSVLNGQLSEQLAAFFPDFPANPTEIRFVGKPVDFIAFCGSSSGCIAEVLFIEVKTGTSSLSPVERSLRKAIIEKKVRYCEYRLP